MSKRLRKIFWLTVLLLTAFSVKGQTFRNDFENGYTWYPPWANIRLEADTLAGDTLLLEQPVANHYCVCPPDQEFGLGFSYAIPDSLNGHNLHLAFAADYSAPASGELAISLKRSGQVLLWQSHDLSSFANDSTGWFRASFTLNLPADQLKGSTLGIFLWNNQQQRILIDNASVTLTPWTMPSYLPDIPEAKNGNPKDSPTEWKAKQETENNTLSTFHFQLSTPSDSLPLTGPIGMLTEFILDGDSVTAYQLFHETENGKWKAGNDLLETTLTNTASPSSLTFQLSTSFLQDGRLLRQAIVVPFLDSALVIYRKNSTVDTLLFQPEYYLDREGFKAGEGSRAVISYHQTGISSTQFDATRRVAFFNLDYWRDHPMIHYPLRDTLEDVFEDVSSRQVTEGQEWTHRLELYVGNDLKDMPRITPIPYGYESGIIFTEHADWTDVRTHRAVLFGNEHITKASRATGGFVFYGIPVTKSVFYNNPDQVTNEEASHGAFPGPHATIKTHKDFEKLLKQLQRIGFDICLHTPEQYTTTLGNLKEALDYMQRHFKSVTWIDHGYNNGPSHNREDLVCDGLDSLSGSHAARQWQSHGIKYLWNAYYEENRMESWYFNNSLMQPYPGFGDALPNRQVTSLPGHDFLAWCTPSTLDANADKDWDFYYSEERLQQLVDNHNVHITHIYPAWANPARGFWTYDADSSLVALPGMNRALERIVALRDEHKLLPMTIKTYLDHYGKLLHVNYEIIDSDHIRLQNTGHEDITGLTLLCSAPIRFEDNRYYEFRKSNGAYYIWFDLKADEQVTIRIIPSIQ